LSPSTFLAALIIDGDKKDDADGDDGGDQEHSDDEVVDLGDSGFDEGGLSMGTEETVEEKVAKVAPEYKPVKNYYTKFNCNSSPDVILAALDKALQSLSIETTTNDFSISCKVEQPSLTFVANVFRDPKDDSGAIVECQRRKGDTADYRAFYAGVRNSMEKYAAKQKITSPEPIEDTTTTEITTTTEVTTSTDTTEVKGTD
jgi:hypothetical protein